MGCVGLRVSPNIDGFVSKYSSHKREGNVWMRKKEKEREKRDKEREIEEIKKKRKITHSCPIPA